MCCWYLAPTTWLFLSFCTDRTDFVEVRCKEHIAVADEVRRLQLRPTVSSQMKAVFRLRPRLQLERGTQLVRPL